MVNGYKNQSHPDIIEHLKRAQGCLGGVVQNRDIKPGQIYFFGSTNLHRASVNIGVQREHNRQPVFVERRDFEYFLAKLQEWKQVYRKPGRPATEK